MPKTHMQVLKGIFCLLACTPLLPSAAHSAQPAAPGLFVRYPEAAKLYGEKRYAEAAAILEPFFAAGPDAIGWFWNSAMYDLACDEALAGRKQKALDILTTWQAKGGGVPVEHLETDPDLASLHDDERFARLVAEARIEERLWTREPAQDLGLSPNLSDDAKIAGLSSLWAEARFNFAFFNRQPNLDWNQTYVDFLSKVRMTRSTEEYYRLLMRFAALLKDGHTSVYPPETLQNAFYGGPALHTSLVETSVVITGIDNPSLVSRGWRIGDVILKIDGEDIRGYAEREIAPYQSSSTPQDLEVRTFNYALLSGRAGSSIRLTVRSGDGREEEREVTRLSMQEQSKLRNSRKVAFNLRRDGIAVLTIDEFEDTDGTKLLLENLPLVASSKGLVIDVRANGGGSTPIDLLQVLSRKAVRGAWVETRSYNAANRSKGVLPGRTDYPPFEVPADPAHHIDVPVAVLTSARTFSAAEDFVAAFHAMQRGITVGETTAGSTGQPLFFQLPGGGSARVCTRNDRASDGTAFEGIGLRPSISISPTAESIRNGSDPVLERAALALLNAK
jgi:C-terminal processing protease CtpA/Prc